MVEKAEVMVADQSMQLAVAKDFVNTGASSSTSNAPDTQVLLLHDVGLRLGRIFLEWAGDTMKQSLVTAAARSTANQAIVGAGVDLAGRLVDAIVA
ncbi:hypothetical protein M406DRAFT_356612 [Cryphonectria parasitica EP155]|uniref:Uncharacterized protein n=1 Tax=Cryphonectria parasitica (strain ATCC 38755 / EP155) TaxID=660469 RepID=A0A9P4Y0B7_CRYP1|nr:uncharacterized protein M406DRAFT_356612 [Cryphonectria parasitica EP155]KAF3764649.1 hypothetical protein M406DRAFT_356612 [Cryphonectria parasitica EP155]